MSDDTKAALTPDEWGSPVVKRREFEFEREPSGALTVTSGWEGVTLFPDDTHHALAALCLHGQPFGFTWDDVDLIRSMDELISEDRGGPLEASDLADRLAALLPPRDPPTTPTTETTDDRHEGP